MAGDPRAIVVMGVSGCGKTTIGEKLASRLDWSFIDGDDFHSKENIAKMASGSPLTDADRAPWLERLRGLIAERLDRGERFVLACSALKQVYRDRLQVSDRVVFVYLRADPAVLRERLLTRRGHSFNPTLLQSQLDTLEEPAGAVWVEAAMPVDQAVDDILQKTRISSPS